MRAQQFVEQRHQSHCQWRMLVEVGMVCGSVDRMPEYADPIGHIDRDVAIDEAVHKHARRGQRATDESQEHGGHDEI